MRPFVLLTLVTTALVAAPLPLSNKEIALMLRTGYSSDAVLAEITKRRLLEPLDETTKKSLLDFGASRQLIGAMESKLYLVSSTEADEAKRREIEIAESRAAQVEQDRQQNALMQSRAAASRGRVATPVTNQTPILETLKTKLMRCHDGSISRGDGSELEKKKLIALYYSAHWCGPCRRFTPQLVDYYNRVSQAHPEFEIIFVSFDRSHFAWESYVQETRMPWLAVDFDQIGALSDLKKMGGDSIPSLLVLDEAGHIIVSSYNGDQYVGPQNVLARLDKIFASNGGGQLAQAP